ncbi:hypothetical protein [Sporofaciens sp. JLR.KK001]|jgi:hypothetical protein
MIETVLKIGLPIIKVLLCMGLVVLVVALIIIIFVVGIGWIRDNFF